MRLLGGGANESALATCLRARLRVAFLSLPVPQVDSAELVRGVVRRRVACAFSWPLVLGEGDGPGSGLVSFRPSRFRRRLGGGEGDS